MASKTSASGNRVTIDDSEYVISSAGAGQYAVTNDFGDKLGYFTVRGRVIDPEDYGVAGAHPLVQIGRLWAAANLPKPEDKSAGPATKGVCRIATHERPADADVEKARIYRAWMRKQPGCKASYYVIDPATGKAQSISIWGTPEQLAVLKAGTCPDGGVALAATSVELFPIVEEP